MTAPKRCPGFDPAEGEYHQPAHELAPTAENFSTNKSLKDGLAVRCRPCDNAYGKAWREAKKAEAASRQPGVAAAEAASERAQAAAKEPTEQVPARSSAAAAPAPAKLVVDPKRTGKVYHDELAVRAGRGKAEGYTTEEIDGIVYALPTNGSAETPEGQAALEAINQATAAARRKRDAARKREERAAKKAAQGTPGPRALSDLLKL